MAVYAGDLFNQNVLLFFRNAFKLLFRFPGMIFFLSGFYRIQRKALTVRKKQLKRGTHIPSVMIISVTSKCNLKCKGCYSAVHHQNNQDNLNEEKLKVLFGEAAELGISNVLIAGGEPLTRKDLFEMMIQRKEILFTLITNGLLLTQEMITSIRKSGNIIPVISIEGDCSETDRRRGSGIYEKVLQKIDLLKMNHVFFGVSVTLTSANINETVHEDFVKEMIQKGVTLFLYVEFVPIQDGTEDLCLDEDARKIYIRKINDFRKKYHAVFITLPGDEDPYGGCLAAGRGFIHVNPEGRVEACPFAPFSDSSITEMPLKDALNSELMKKIRDNHGSLTETRGGCALWNQKDWVDSLMKE